MEAINPGHPNRLLNYDLDPAQPPYSITVAGELYQWYEESVESALAPSITEEELAEPTFLFSSLDENELSALYGLVRAAKWTKDPALQSLQDQIVDAFPQAEAASLEGLEKTNRFMKKHQHLSRILRPQRGVLRSVLALNDSTKDFWLSKGAIHTRDPITSDDTVFSYGEVDRSEVALLTVHEVLIRRLAKQDSTRHTRLPFEYSRVDRWFETEPHSFPDIDAARRFVGRIAAEGVVLPNMNEPYQQGLLSILQNCSLFPDVVACFRNGDRAGFIEMQKKIAQLWPTPGTHGAFAQCGLGFDSGLLHYDGRTVLVADDLQKGLDSLPHSADKLDVARRLQIPLYIGRRSTITFEPTDLPDSSEDTRSIAGRLKFYTNESPIEQKSYARCPALARQNSVISAMAAVVYDHAKALCASSLSAKITELDDKSLAQLVDTPEFRSHISQKERDTWVDEDETNMLDTGAFRSPDLLPTYLTETATPVLLQLGKEAARGASSQWFEIISEE